MGPPLQSPAPDKIALLSCFYIISTRLPLQSNSRRHLPDSIDCAGDCEFAAKCDCVLHTSDVYCGSFSSSPDAALTTFDRPASDIGNNYLSMWSCPVNHIVVGPIFPSSNGGFCFQTIFNLNKNI
jgi:hypothetical protein